MDLKLIDTHTHLDHEYPFTTEEYLKNAKAQGVCRFVTIGTTPQSLEPVKELAEKFEEVYFTVGIHPHEAKDYTREVEDKILELQKHSKCVGIGEIGLDYYYDHSAHEDQIHALERQLDLAVRVKKPVVIHARDAESDLEKLLRNYAKTCQIPARPGIIHCFSGTQNFADVCIELGFYLSFSGIITFKSAQQLRDIAKSIPLNRLLIETDAPFLAPVPYRGKPNQSAYLIETAKTLAEIKQVELSTLAATTAANAHSVFAF